MAGKVLELQNLLDKHGLAESIAEMWQDWSSQRNTWVEEQKEKRNFLFATDTTKTTNSSLPWKNSTTTPKLTQIRDNLHANYLSALFPNDNWLRWEGYTLDDEELKKRAAIEAYMSNKVRESDFRSTMSQLLLDYIDYGNAFADVIFVNESSVDPTTGETIAGYIGPKVVRISPMDVVFNPLAADFKSSPKITRCVKSLGELRLEAEENPDNAYLKDALEQRDEVARKSGAYSIDDFHKALGFCVDGFGNMQEYYQSDYVELIEVTGDVADPDTGKVLKNHIITIMDRCKVIRKEPMANWLGNGSMAHVGWRLRPDNLYAMGPLDNLVGMQYRIDHLENMKADAMDLAVFPPVVIAGEVEEFEWGPAAEIHIDESGSVTELGKNLNAVITAENQIATLEQKMEQYAGAPREAMGIRSAGEKTAFEVQQLQNAAGRIFQEKITTFEISLLEPILNAMLESARRNMSILDVARVMDDDLGVVQFIEITKEDITARGKLRPVGARHFAAQAQLLQNLTGVMNSPIGQKIDVHLSSKALAALVEDVLGLERFQLIQPNVAIFEQADTQRLVSQVQEDLEVEQMTPVE
jgi:hypothetical protein